MGMNHSVDRRGISRLHYAPGRQCSLGRVNYSNLAPFSYNRSCVFDGKFPRTGQEVGEDTPKEKMENRVRFLSNTIRDLTRVYSESIQFLNLLIICRYVSTPCCVLSLERGSVLMLMTYQPSWVFAGTLVRKCCMAS